MINDINPINPKMFKNEYLCQWPEPSLTYLKAYELWVYYQYKCEIYDRTICTGPIAPDGGIMPANTDEHRLINKHAIEMYNYINNEGQKHGAYFDFKAWKQAKRDAGRLNWKGLQEEYKRLFGEANKSEQDS